MIKCFEKTDLANFRIIKFCVSDGGNFPIYHRDEVTPPRHIPLDLAGNWEFEKQIGLPGFLG